MLNVNLRKMLPNPWKITKDVHAQALRSLSLEDARDLLKNYNDESETKTDTEFLEEADRVELIIEIYYTIMMLIETESRPKIHSRNEKTVNNIADEQKKSPSKRPRSPNVETSENKKEKTTTTSNVTSDEVMEESSPNADDDDVSMTTKSKTSENLSDETSPHTNTSESQLETLKFDENILERMSTLVDSDFELLAVADMLVYLRHNNSKYKYAEKNQIRRE